MNIGQSATLLPQQSSSPLDSIRRNNIFTLPRPSFATSEPSLSPPPSESIEEEIEQCRDNHLDLVTCVPFPLCSVNLITCSSNSGKTHFLDQVIRHRQWIFESPEKIQRIVYVNGNERDFSGQHPWLLTTDSDSSEINIDLTVLSLSLDEFVDIASILQPKDILILDDILKVNEDIQFILKYGAHHYSLSSVFVVTQSCLSSPLYSLLSSVHSIVLLFGNSTTTRLAHHLINFFFFCPDTKKYLKSIFALAEKQHDTVILKLNTIASHRFHSNILAFTNVQNLFVKHPKIPFCLVYAELSHIETISNKMPKSIVADMPLDTDYLNEAFVLVPVSRVRNIKPQANEDENGKICGNEKENHWNNFNAYLKTEIESAFPHKRWNPMINLAREILLCSDFCISFDFRTISTKQKPNQLFSIIDFLNVATRKNAPNESREKVSHYKPLVQVLLKNNVPHSFILNKLLLPDAKESRRYNKRSFQYNDVF